MLPAVQHAHGVQIESACESVPTTGSDERRHSSQATKIKGDAHLIDEEQKVQISGQTDQTHPRPQNEVVPNGPTSEVCQPSQERCVVPSSRFSDWSSVHSDKRNRRLSVRAARLIKKRTSLILTLKRNSYERQKQRPSVPSADQDDQGSKESGEKNKKHASNTTRDVFAENDAEQAVSKWYPPFFGAAAECNFDFSDKPVAQRVSETRVTESPFASSTSSNEDSTRSGSTPVTSSTPSLQSPLGRSQSPAPLPAKSKKDAVSAKRHRSFPCSVRRIFGRPGHRRSSSICTPSEETKRRNEAELDPLRSSQELEYQRSLWRVLHHEDFPMASCLQSRGSHVQQQDGLHAPTSWSSTVAESITPDATPLSSYRNHLLDEYLRQSIRECGLFGADGVASGHLEDDGLTGKSYGSCTIPRDNLVKDSPLDVLAKAVAGSTFFDDRVSGQDVMMGKAISPEGTIRMEYDQRDLAKRPIVQDAGKDDSRMSVLNVGTSSADPPASASASTSTGTGTGATSADDIWEPTRGGFEGDRSRLDLIMPRPLLCPSLYRADSYHHCACQME